MLKQYLKHNRWFRTLFFLPLWVRGKLISNLSGGSTQTYRQVVVGGQLKVSPSNIEGIFNLNATSDLAKRVVTTGNFEPEITALIRRLPITGGDVINIGANVGFYSIFFAKEIQNVGQIYAIEPNPEAFAYLQMNIAENLVSGKVKPVQACIGAEAGEVEFSIIPGMPEYSSIGQIVHPSASNLATHTIKVSVQRLDEVIAIDSVNAALIFIDTEGAEFLVIKGAESILKKSFPIIIFECDDALLKKFGHSSKMLDAYLESIGYTVRNALDTRFALQHPFAGEAIAIPANRLTDLMGL